ncbi:MAG: hypothetical protein ACE5G1_16890 [bacterium]
MNSNKTAIKIFPLLWSLLCLAFPAGAQDSNFKYPIAEIEQALRSRWFQVTNISTLKRLGEAPGSTLYQAKQVTLKFLDGKTMKVKWKTAPHQGETFNNQPRYEIAAYQLQKLFLEPEEYVVPPTVGQCLPLQQYRVIDNKVIPTFDNSSAVFCVLQYWLDNVTFEKIYDKKRFESDPKYARHLGNMNIFSYLIKHMDSNVGNFLISTDRANPRVFAVDNGVAFGGEASARGTRWRDLRVKSVPKETIDRLRKITLEDLEKHLGVVAQFAVVNGQLVPKDPTPNLDKEGGVRQKDDLIQFGLTAEEVMGVYNRLNKLLQDVDAGKIQTF